MKAFLVVVAVAWLGGACGGGGALSGSGGGIINPSGRGGVTGSGSTPIVGGGGSGLVGTGTGAISGGACGAVEPAEAVPAEVMIVLDTSLSMNDAIEGACPGGCRERSKWAAADAAIRAAIDTPASVYWGLKFIAETREACDTGGVASPIGYGNNSRIPYTLAYRSSAGGLDAPGNTPTRAAINVAAAHLSARPPGPHHVIVLVTDGAPDCAPGAPGLLASDAAGAVQAVEDARSWGFDTLVIGIGNIDPTAAAALDDIARSGGRARAGSPAYVRASTSAEIAAAMNDLTAQIAGCTFATPEPPTNDGTTSRFSIGVRLDDQQVPLDPYEGWSYADDAARTIQLNGAACAMARAGKLVKVVFHCAGLQ